MAGTNIVCQTCGTKGRSDCLTFCIKCRMSAIHRYCLDKLPGNADEEVIWTCDECTPKDVKVDTSLFRKSQRIGLIKEKTEARKKMKRRYPKPPLAINVEVTTLAELTHLTDRLTGPVENVPRHTSISENNGSHEKKRQRRLVLSEEAEDKFEPRKVTSSPYRKPPLAIKAEVTTLAQLTQYTDELAGPVENVPGHTSTNENNVCHEKRGQRRLIHSEESGDKFEPSKVTASPPTYDSYDDSSDKSPGHLPADSKIYLRGEPVNDRIWRGHFNVRNHKKGLKLAAHLSNLASPKVKDAAGKLPKVLNLDILPRDDVWPKSFRTTTPTDQSIALYFLPEYETEENDFDVLLEDMINNDLALKTVVADSELLIFTSCELTTEHWRLETKYYLWAVFRHVRGKNVLGTSNALALVPYPTGSF